MKNQYFGDINDYLKYGLVRQLTGRGEIPSSVCWMLTPDDGSRDGASIDYLKDPPAWREHDPELYDQLRYLVFVERARNVNALATTAILPNCRFHTEILTEDPEARTRYFETFAEVARGSELVFFDPDNGLEVKSISYGRKDSSKYLFWREVEMFFGNGHSVLVYQHIPRVKRAPYLRKLLRGMASHTTARTVYAFESSRVLFLLAVQNGHRRRFRKASGAVQKAWGDRFKVESVSS
jgi:hypothetical protein